MTNEEVQEIIDRAEDEYDRLKDRVHEQYEEIERLHNIIKEVGDKINKDYWWNWDTDNDKIIREILEIINKAEGKK